MSYRFLKMTSAYPEFVSAFTKENPGHRSIPYDELHRRLIATRYGLSDFYARQMRALGNEAWEVFASVEVLQRAWAREHDLPVGSRTWLHEIAAAQVEDMKPDVIFLQDLFLFDSAFRELLRSAASKHTVIVGWRSSPTTDFSSFADLDMILSASPHFVDHWRSLGSDARLLPLAFEPSVISEVPLGERDLPFTFVGQIGASTGPHAQRRKLLEALIERTPLEVHGGLSASGRNLTQVLRQLRESRSPRALLPTRQRRSIPKRRLHQAVFGLEYYCLLGRSQVTFNHHISAAGRYAGNLRLYEATGMASCLLTDDKVDLGRYFEVDREVVAYENEADCIEKVSYLLDHPAERSSIAVAGQRRTLEDHTYEVRVRLLDEWLKDLLASRKGVRR